MWSSCATSAEAAVCRRARSPFTMAPKRGLSIERTTEYEDFMKDLAAFHEKRGYVT